MKKIIDVFICMLVGAFLLLAIQSCQTTRHEYRAVLADHMPDVEVHIGLPKEYDGHPHYSSIYGVYDVPMERIYISPLLGAHRALQTFWHEYGHHVWYKYMTEEERVFVCQKYEEDGAPWDEYANTDCFEFWAVAYQKRVYGEWESLQLDAPTYLFPIIDRYNHNKK